MQHSYYEDYKYCIQEISTVYIGCKYTFAEILEEENIPFKFRAVAENYILPKADMEDTLETHLYYLPADSFLVKIYDRLKAKVKINIIEEKKHLNGKIKREYTTKILSVKQLSSMPVEEKQKYGVVIQELSVNKLALMSF